MEWLSLFPYIPRFADLYNDILLNAHAYKHAMNLDVSWYVKDILVAKYEEWCDWLCTKMFNLSIG